MYTLSKVKPSSSSSSSLSLEAKIVSQCHSHSVKSNIFLPNTKAKAAAANTRLIYHHHHRPASTGERRAVIIMGSSSNVDDRIPRISSSIRVIPDFPKPGIMFQDITTLLLDPTAFKDTIDLFVERYKDKNINVIAGIEARGFIFGPPIALAIGAKFVPMRKPKKLPGEVISEEYSLEYGTDIMEMHVGAVKPGERAVIVDDLIATGGTLNAAIRLLVSFGWICSVNTTAVMLLHGLDNGTDAWLERVEVQVVECACVIELPELQGRDRLGDNPLFVLVSST
ncbi:hypothetical protein BUALT_Bualt01G0137100 [Buddleja alternifolia]|uniref:adenine phosphoribosyltransferase n=1 Tax=Buddleja alternifolia TaxID=168488 RepID=A0AAV6YHC6_9LAMI|nr:hypothetical protein BUALT_Bualt01G0137100 [Buddleja alternifolia]